MRIVRFNQVITLICCALLSACGTGGPDSLEPASQPESKVQVPAASQPAGPPGLARSLPSTGVDSPLSGTDGLPAPDTLAPRFSSFTVADGHRNGAEYDALLPNNRVLSSVISLGFSPDYSTGEPLADVAYALYSFTLPDAGPALSISFDWASPPAAADFFVALANYQSNRWDWFKPASVDAFDDSDITPYLDEQDGLILALIVLGTAPATLTELQIKATEAPQAVLQSDVTGGLAPLAVNFDASGSSDPDGSIVNFEWDFDGDGNFNENDNGEDLAQGSAQPASFVYSNPGVFNAAVRVTDDKGASASASLAIDVNGAPSVVLVADVTNGAAPLLVSFTAQPNDDGSIVDFEWDFDGDGLFNEADNGEDLAQGNAAAQYSYTDEGQFNATVRVTDDKGATASGSRLIHVGGLPMVTLSADPLSGNKPLNVNFTAMASDDGAITDYEWDFDGDGLFNEADNGEDLAQGTSAPSFIYTAAGTFEAAVRVTDDLTNQSSDSVTIQVNNQSPVAVLQASPLEGPAPLDVDLDGSGSYDNDGAITDFEWDLNGNDVFNETGPELDNQGQASIIGYTFSDPGSYTVNLRVTDEDGATGVDSVVITAQAWTIVPLATGGNVDGTSSSMALIGGNPAVVWRRSATTARLMYRRSSTTTGATAGDWSGAQTVVTADVALYGTSLAEVAMRPAVAYQSSDGTLHFSRGDDTGGWQGPGGSNVQVDTDSDSGRWPSLRVVNGNPAIGYVSYGSGNIVYVRSTNSTGSTGTWGGKITVFDGTDVSYSDMQIVGGNPALTFSDNTGQILKFIRSTSINGDMAADWPAGNICDVATSTLASYCGLTTANSNPAIGYVDINNDLRFARCSTSAGASTADWTAGSNVVAEGSLSSDFGFSRVNFVQGTPVFAYTDTSVQDMYYTVSSNADGDAMATWTEELVDGATTQMQEASNIILLGSGQVAFCYFNVDNGDLMYAFHN